jgi:transglutaminase-like putative cysteine protease
MIDFPNPDVCLKPGVFIDSDSDVLREFVSRPAYSSGDPVQNAIALFEYVRDQVQYEFKLRLVEEQYKASYMLGDGLGFCVRKSILLCGLLRAAGIPSALIFSDMRDESLPPHVTKILGTNVMHHHGLTGVYLDGEWYKLDASLSPDVVSKRKYRPVVFDGRSDALQSDTTEVGASHITYVKFHGAHPDLVYDDLMMGLAKGYDNADSDALEAMGFERVPSSYREQS